MYLLNNIFCILISINNYIIIILIDRKNGKLLQISWLFLFQVDFDQTNSKVGEKKMNEDAGQDNKFKKKSEFSSLADFSVFSP